jgi:cytochrome P450
MSKSEMLMSEVDFARDEVPDLHDRLDKLRAHGPVVRVKFHDNPTWLILGHKELKDAFFDNEAFDAGEGYMQIAAPSLGKTIMTMSGDEHRINRALITKPFLPNKIRNYIEPIFEPVAHELLDRMPDTGEVEFTQAFTKPYPFKIITRLLGIPVEDDELLLQWAEKLFDYPWDPEGALQAKDAFTTYLEPIIEARRATPRDDLISMLAAAEQDGERLDNEEILSFVRLLFPAGSDTTYKIGGSLFARVLADPELKAKALDGQKERDAIVNEALRLEAPTALLPRLASGDRELGGVTIRKGEWVIFGITASNHDSAVFPESRHFDSARGNRSKNLTFGRGMHVCLGQHLARRDLEVALRIVLTRYPDMQLSTTKPVEYLSPVLRGPRELWVRPHG